MKLEKGVDKGLNDEVPSRALLANEFFSWKSKGSLSLWIPMTCR